jgi:phosphomannomutase
VVPTPTLLLAVGYHGAAGALGVTASHNPAQWNAFKFAGADGTFLDADRMLRFQAFLREREIPRAGWDALGEVREDAGAIDRHLERILALPYLDVGAIRARGFRVALDCVHGAGGRMVPRLLEALGCEVHGIGLEPDGRFPRDPEPTAANLGIWGTWSGPRGRRWGSPWIPTWTGCRW